jgi:hypothetical protein
VLFRAKAPLLSKVLAGWRGGGQLEILARGQRCKSVRCCYDFSAGAKSFVVSSCTSTQME